MTRKTSHNSSRKPSRKVARKPTRKFSRMPYRQLGSATMVVTVGVIIVGALTAGAAAYWMTSHSKKPSVATPITEPVSPYDDLLPGDSNNDLKSNVLNIKSGLAQEALHLQGVEAVVNDQQGAITDQ